MSKYGFAMPPPEPPLTGEEMYWQNYGQNVYDAALDEPPPRFQMAPSAQPRNYKRTPTPRTSRGGGGPAPRSYNMGGGGSTGARYQGRYVPGSTNKGRSYGASYGGTSSKGGPVSTYRYRTQDDPTKRSKFDMSPSSGRLYTEDVGRTQQKIRDMKAATDAKSAAARGGGGSGRSRGSGGQKSNRNVTYTQSARSLARSYANAANAANAANESRYGQILGEFNQALGGGGGGGTMAPRGGGFIRNNGGRMSIGGSYGQWKDSGSTLPYYKWKQLMQAAEIKALQTGGQFGGMDATGLYPRQYGSGQFLGLPGAAGSTLPNTSSPYPPAPPRPAIPEYTMPVRPTPSFAVGTPFVRNTGTAQLHQGEAVVPAAMNPAAQMTPQGPRPAPGVTPNAPMMDPSGRTPEWGQRRPAPSTQIPGRGGVQRPAGNYNMPGGGGMGASGGGIGTTPTTTPAKPTGLGYTSRSYYDDLRAKAAGTFGERSDALQQSYEDRQKALQKQLEGYGRQQLADQSQRAQNLQSNIQQDMVSRGLTGSTVMPSMQLAGARESAAERARINENLQAMKTGLAERTSSDTLGYRRGNELDRMGLGQSDIRDSYANYVGDRGFAEEQFLNDRNFGRGAFESDRAFQEGQFQSDRGFGLQQQRLNRQDFESDRAYNMAVKQQDFDNFMQRLSREDRMLLEKLGFMERRNDMPPDINQMMAALQQYGQYGR